MQTSPQPLTEEQPTRAKRSRNWLGLAPWIAGGVAALVGLYAALGFWVAPKVIRSQVVAQVAEKYHRKASIGEVKFNPFTLKLEANALQPAGRRRQGDDQLRQAGGGRFDGLALAAGIVFNEISLAAPKGAADPARQRAAQRRGPDPARRPTTSRRRRS